jgi:DNA repair exonuclease SbcCD nuclease subunit
MKFLHAADIHLDSPLHRLEAYEGAPVEEIRQASRRAFENLVDLALDGPVDFVLIAGDLFDGEWKDYNSGLYFVRQMRRLADGNIPVFIVSGNHDAEGKMTRTLPYPDSVHVFPPNQPGTRILRDRNVAIHGQSFSRAAVWENLALGYPEPVPGLFNIGLLHTSLTGRQGHEPYAPCTPDDLINRGYDYWALGHVHQFEIVVDDPPVVFPGCIQGRNVRETGGKGCVLVTGDEGMPLEVSRRDLDVIRWETLSVDLSGEDDMAGCTERFREGLGAVLDRNDPLPVVVRVEFHGETALHRRLASEPEHLRETLRSLAIGAFGERAWIENIRVRTSPVGRPAPEPGPLRELALLVESLTGSESGLLGLGEELSDLFRKLPAEYRRGEGRIRPEDPEQMGDLVRQAHATLARMLKKEAASS